MNIEVQSHRDSEQKPIDRLVNIQMLRGRSCYLFGSEWERSAGHRDQEAARIVRITSRWVFCVVFVIVVSLSASRTIRPRLQPVGKSPNCSASLVFKSCLSRGRVANFEEWRASNAQQLLIDTQFILQSDSIMVDIGAFTGETLQKYWQKYQPRVYAFEPVQSFREALYRKFNSSRVTILPYGIGPVEEDVFVSLAGDATAVRQSNTGHKIHLRPLDAFFAEHLPVGQVDLLFINCEGCEYSVMQYLVNSMHIRRMNVILIQFHSNVQDWLEKRCCINAELARTHHQYFNYPNIWEGWVLKS